MINLIPYILILLAIAAFGMIFIFRVLYKQLKLYKRPITDKDISHFRDVLLAISLTILFMGLIHIAINVYTLFDPSGRPPKVSTLSFVYSMGVHIQSLLLSYLLWRIYRLATDDIDDKEK